MSVRRVVFDRPVAVIGDIHGRLDHLDRLLAKLGGLPIVVAGDLCDRGPDTRGVIDRLIERGAVGVMGNHDEWLLAWANGEGFDTMALSPMMAGGATLASYGVEGRTPSGVEAQAWRVPSAHREFLRGLAVALDLVVCGSQWWVVHAGIAPHVEVAGLILEEVVPHLARTQRSTLLWSSTDPAVTLPVDRPVIMGHIVQREPYDGGHVLAIDTGCGTTPGGYLTAVVLPERRFVTSKEE